MRPLLRPLLHRGHHTGATETTKEQFFPLYRGAISFIYLSVIRGRRRGDRHGFHPPRTERVTIGDPTRIHGALLTSQRGPLGVSMQIPQAMVPDLYYDAPRSNGEERPTRLNEREEEGGGGGAAEEEVRKERNTRERQRLNEGTS